MYSIIYAAIVDKFRTVVGKLKLCVQYATRSKTLYPANGFFSTFKCTGRCLRKGLRDETEVLNRDCKIYRPCY
jgi:hypothetical protein